MTKTQEKMMNNDAELNVKTVELKVVENDFDGELAEVAHYECAYCGKNVKLNTGSAKLHQRLNSNEFYCNFCLRHKLYTKSNRHILMLTFRSIIGYYYYVLYRTTVTNQKMYYSEINDCIASHMETGLQNPVFHYDPQTYIWFIDFSRVGQGKGKIPCVDVLRTISNIIVCFNLSRISNIKIHELYNKYQEAVEKFYTQRNRPYGKKLLVPTLQGCGIFENTNFDMDNTRNFTLSQFIRHNA